MKKLILISIMLASGMSGFAQGRLLGRYDINNFNKNIYCSLYFYKNDCYNLEFFEYLSDDIVEITTLSYGHFSLKSNQIILVDEAHGFEMKMKFSSRKDIAVTQGFPFLRDKIFSFHGDSYGKECIKVDINITGQKRERERYKQSHTTLYPLYYTAYESEANTFTDDEYRIYETGHGYELEIQKENKYTLYYKRILISEGTWKREGNELLLFDINLQHSFYVLIGEKELISKYLPGDYRSTALYIKKKKPANFSERNTSFDAYRSRGLPVAEEVDPNEPLYFVEIMPQFPQGGEEAMLRFIKENTHYPESARKAGIKGHVILNCIIEKDGSINPVKVTKKLSPQCDEEAIRVIKSMPKWIPGRHNGIVVAIRYTVMVDFGTK